MSSFSNGAAEERGAIHTRPEVAEFVLDAVGWLQSKPLASLCLLEPSVGEGDFLLPAVERLICCFIPDDPAIEDCIRAVEINEAALKICRNRIEAVLLKNGWSRNAAENVLGKWLLHDDFLTIPMDRTFSHIVGNPPYIRLENLPKALLKDYRSRWRSLFDRADIYVAFIEKSLELLSAGGRLGFICADRWMKNRYGRPLRNIVASRFHLESYVDFTGCPAFFNDVDAYPAVTVIRKGKGDKTCVAFRPKISKETLVPLARALANSEDHAQVSILSGICRSDQPWSFDENGDMETVRKLEVRFPVLEASGCKVGIGVATGADAIFIGSADQLDVESERKIPLVTTRDIRNGLVDWGGLYVLNPFEEEGQLVDPAMYPKFQAYIEKHRELIEKRNVAGRNPKGWFRTIDRIHASLTCTPKLLIPDIKGTAHVVLEEGRYYPHHNLYFVISESWDLRVLQMILSCRVAHAFIAAYSPRMRGNFLRFQAQYLRRIRIPHFSEIDKALKKELLGASRSSSQSEKDAMIQKLYELSDFEWKRLDPQTLTA
ncbi:MAG: Eco57I restriction-modification methylase domain-containing protein [Verrucomicrobiae bacterium]